MPVALAWLWHDGDGHVDVMSYCKVQVLLGSGLDLAALEAQEAAWLFDVCNILGHGCGSMAEMVVGWVLATDFSLVVMDMRT